MPEEMIVRWTARFAVACYVARLMFDITGLKSIRSARAACWWWTAGCAIFLVHVTTAFHFEYGWNHTIAYEYTARRTAEMTGWKSGVGLYVNEAFLCLWLADTILWWRNLNWPQNRVAYWIVHGVFGFLMIQATAVFGPAFWKPVVLVVLTCLLIQCFRYRNHRPLTRPSRCEEAAATEPWPLDD